MCSSTLSSTSSLDGVGGHRHAPAALPLGKTAGTNCIGDWVGPTGIRSSDRAARSESLYRLSYRGPLEFCKLKKIRMCAFCWSNLQIFRNVSLFLSSFRYMLRCYLPINKYTIESVHCLCAAEFLRN
jgi:hypothetical protein